MKRTLILACLLMGIGPASLASADCIGIWRWLGLGWGPGYHAGGGMPANQSLPIQGQPVGPAWEDARPVGPQVAPAPEPLPNAGARRGSISPAQQAALRLESLRRTAWAPAKTDKPAFSSYFESNR